MAAADDAGEWSYWRALRSGRLGALLAGNLISSVGNGMLAAPVGLALAGPLVSAAGARDAMIISALLTIALVPLAASGLRRARP